MASVGMRSECKCLVGWMLSTVVHTHTVVVWFLHTVILYTLCDIVHTVIAMVHVQCIVVRLWSAQFLVWRTHRPQNTMCSVCKSDIVDRVVREDPV